MIIINFGQVCIGEVMYQFGRVGCIYVQVVGIIKYVGEGYFCIGWVDFDGDFIFVVEQFELFDQIIVEMGWIGDCVFVNFWVGEFVKSVVDWWWWVVWQIVYVQGWINKSFGSVIIGVRWGFFVQEYFQCCLKMVDRCLIECIELIYGVLGCGCSFKFCYCVFYV